MIGWGGEDVPGHPVPINKEGNACMHMQRDNEGIRLPKLLGLAVAGATLLAGMVVLPATHASADETYGYNAEDDFRPGPLQSSRKIVTSRGLLTRIIQTRLILRSMQTRHPHSSACPMQPLRSPTTPILQIRFKDISIICTCIRRT